MSYMYAVARLRAMENRFLEAAFFSRLMDCISIEEALKSLTETVYAQWLPHAEGESSFDKVIDDELLHTFEELKQFVPDKELLALYRMPYDFNNIKVVLKSLFKVKDGGERRYDLLSPLGFVETERVILALEGEEYSLLPYGLGGVIPRCWTTWEQTKNIQSVEILLDDAMFSAMLELAQNLKMPVLTDWVRQKIDAENLRNALRLQRMKYETLSALPFFHKGGTLVPADLGKLLSEPLEAWSKALSHKDIGRIFDTIQDRSDVQLCLSEVSLALEEHLIHFLEKRKYVTTAPENVILYLLYKELEARNLRVALVSVSNGLNRDHARRLLSHVR